MNENLLKMKKTLYKCNAIKALKGDKEHDRTKDGEIVCGKGRYMFVTPKIVLSKCPKGIMTPCDLILIPNKKYRKGDMKRRYVPVKYRDLSRYKEVYDTEFRAVREK